MKAEYPSDHLADKAYAPEQTLLIDPENNAQTEPAISPGEFLCAVASEAIAHARPRPENGMNREHEVYKVQWDPESCEVMVESTVTAEDYKSVTLPEDQAYIEEQAKPLEGTVWAFINPTDNGGGVAMMRPPLVHKLRQHGIDAHWIKMRPRPEEEIVDDQADNPFVFTKLMHNISQRMTDKRITPEGKKLHWDWADGQNGPVLEKNEVIQKADFIVIDDPQPAPLIARLKAVNPNAKFIWRNHIDTSNTLMSDPTSPQGEISTYLLDDCGVRDVDAVLAHPVQEFVHPGMDDKTYFGPATFDHFDNLNRHLSEEEIAQGIEFINAEIRAKNERLRASGNDPADMEPQLNLDPTQKRVTLIARFDPSKRMDLAMDMGVMTRRKMRDMGVPEDELPEVVIVGNGSVDDPDGTWMYEEMLRLRREKYPDEMNKIIIMRLKHNYDAMNALMSRSDIIMQTSDAEGLETRISDAIKHGKPVVIRKRGGMDTQVVDGKSGIVLRDEEPDQGLDRGARHMAFLLTSPAVYQEWAANTKEMARELNLREFTTPANVARFLRIGNRLRAGLPADKVWKMSEFAAMRKASLEEQARTEDRDVVAA